MPAADGTFKGIAVPKDLCARCKLFACVCEPVSRPLPVIEHPGCGTPQCCKQCC